MIKKNPKGNKEKLATVKKDHQTNGSNTIIRIANEQRNTNLYVIPEIQEEVKISSPNCGAKSNKNDQMDKITQKENDYVTIEDNKDNTMFIQCKHCKSIHYSRTKFEEHIKQVHMNN